MIIVPQEASSSPTHETVGQPRASFTVETQACVEHDRRVQRLHCRIAKKRHRSPDGTKKASRNPGNVFSMRQIDSATLLEPHDMTSQYLKHHPVLKPVMSVPQILLCKVV